MLDQELQYITIYLRKIVLCIFTFCCIIKKAQKWKSILFYDRNTLSSYCIFLSSLCIYTILPPDSTKPIMLKKPHSSQSTT